MRREDRSRHLTSLTHPHQAEGAVTCSLLPCLMTAAVSAVADDADDDGDLALLPVMDSERPEVEGISAGRRNCLELTLPEGMGEEG